MKALEIIKERNERYLSLFGSWLDLFDGASLIIIRRLFFDAICVILIGLNVYSQIRCMEIDKDYERYEKLCNEYKQGNFTDDELENLQLELDAGVKIIKKALGVFIFKILLGVIWIPAICFIPRIIYDFYKDNYLRFIIDFEDKISLVLIVFMVIIMLFDITSPLDEISNYWKLGQTMINVMENIHFERALQSF